MQLVFLNQFQLQHVPYKLFLIDIHIQNSLSRYFARMVKRGEILEDNRHSVIDFNRTSLFSFLEEKNSKSVF